MRLYETRRRFYCRGGNAGVLRLTMILLGLLGDSREPHGYLDCERQMSRVRRIRLWTTFPFHFRSLFWLLGRKACHLGNFSKTPGLKRDGAIHTSIVHVLVNSLHIEYSRISNCLHKGEPQCPAILGASSPVFLPRRRTDHHVRHDN